LIERLRREVVAANADNRNVTAVPVALLREAAAALEAAREDACVLRRDNERLAEARWEARLAGVGSAKLSNLLDEAAAPQLGKEG